MPIKLLSKFAVTVIKFPGSPAVVVSVKVTEEILEDIVETTWPGFKGNRKPWEPGFVPARQ